MVSALALPFIYATLLWFFSTGAILWLNRLPVETHKGAIVAATPLAGAAVCGLIVSAPDTGAASAYLAFSSAIIIWGWHEMSFLMGFINGPRRGPCPAGVQGWDRFRVSTEAVIHHEVAIALTLVAIVAFSWGQPNQIGVLTFAILFAMRLSTKLNIFLGVANLSAEMMPDHLAYLKSYFREARMNTLFPWSLAGSIALAVYLVPFALEMPGFALLLALTLLAIVEHAFMMLPVRDAALWGWAAPDLQKPKNNVGRP